MDSRFRGNDKNSRLLKTMPSPRRPLTSGCGADTQPPELAGLEVFEVELGRAGGGSTLLKALPTINRSPLSRFEGNGSFFSALSAGGCGLGAVVALPAQGLAPLYLARLAALGFVLKPPVGKEELLPGSKNEFCSAVDTLKDPIAVLHIGAPLPFEQGPTRCEMRCGLAPRG